MKNSQECAKSGKARNPRPPQSRQARQNQKSYAEKNFSKRLGALIPESDVALQKTRFDWLAEAEGHNLGPSHGMTTFVAICGITT